MSKGTCHPKQRPTQEGITIQAQDHLGNMGKHKLRHQHQQKELEQAQDQGRIHSSQRSDSQYKIESISFWESNERTAADSGPIDLTYRRRTTLRETPSKGLAAGLIDKFNRLSEASTERATVSRINYNSRGSVQQLFPCQTKSSTDLRKSGYIENQTGPHKGNTESNSKSKNISIDDADCNNRIEQTCNKLHKDRDESSDRKTSTCNQAKQDTKGEVIIPIIKIRNGECIENSYSSKDSNSAHNLMYQIDTLLSDSENPQSLPSPASSITHSQACTYSSTQSASKERNPCDPNRRNAKRISPFLSDSELDRALMEIQEFSRDMNLPLFDTNDTSSTRTYEDLPTHYHVLY